MSDFDNQNEEIYEEVNTNYSSAPQEKESNVFAIISMICGIISIICCCFGWISVVIGVAAVVLGIVSIKKNESKKGMAIAGIICGSVGLVLIIIMLISGAALGALFTDSDFLKMLPPEVVEQIEQSL